MSFPQMLNKMAFLENQPTVIHHHTNIRGRDFIVGDLHGCRAMMDRLLDHVAFDTDRDRLFSVGDLVDRGPDSEGCLDLLHEPWFFPVMGNHDAMLMAFLAKKISEQRDRRLTIYARAFSHNSGFEWVHHFERASEFLPLMKNIPLVRVIGRNDGLNRFHVAHAELRLPAPDDSYSFTDMDLDTENSKVWDVMHFVPGFDDAGDWRDHALWGRSLIDGVRRNARNGGETPPENCPHLSTTYVGHTIIPPVFGSMQSAPLRVGSHVFLDSGAFAANAESGSKNPRCGLTIWCHAERRGWLLNGANDVREIG